MAKFVQASTTTAMPLAQLILNPKRTQLIWRRIQRRFTIITRAANAAVAPLHDRMPVIMAPNHFGWWLKNDGERSESHKMALGHPLEEPLKIYPVSDLVNSPKTDDARCIEPVRIDRDMFERQWWGDEGKS
jgi:putative SOS response-associated peptidase YedK